MLQNNRQKVNILSKHILELQADKGRLTDELTKAKELLKRCYENYIYLEPLRSEIKRFLNSEREIKVKIPLSVKIRNLFSPCRKCKKGISYHCMYCKKSEVEK